MYVGLALHGVGTDAAGPFYLYTSFSDHACGMFLLCCFLVPDSVCGRCFDRNGARRDALLKKSHAPSFEMSRRNTGARDEDLDFQKGIYDERRASSVVVEAEFEIMPDDDDDDDDNGDDDDLDPDIREQEEFGL